MGIAEIEPAFRFLAGVVGVTVEVEVLTQIRTVVGEELQIVSDEGLPPDLRGIGYVRIARGNQARGIIALHRADGFARVAVFQAEVGPGTLVAQAEIARDGKQLAIAEDAFAVLEAADFGLDRQPVGAVLEAEVQHAGNGVRAVLGRRAVAQDLHALERDRRDGCQVRPLCAIGDAIAQPVNHRSAMTALAVDQDQRVVGGQPPHVGRPDDGARIADRLGIDVVRGHDIAYKVG